MMGRWAVAGIACRLGGDRRSATSRSYRRRVTSARNPDLEEEVSEAYAADVARKLDRYVLPVVRPVPIAAFTIVRVAPVPLDHARRRVTGATSDPSLTCPERSRASRTCRADLGEGEAVALDALWLALPELHVHVPADDRADTSASRTVSNGGASSAIAAVHSDKSSDAGLGFPRSGVTSYSVEDMGIEPTASRVRFRGF